MLTVASFDNVVYAEMFKAKLESEGVRCCVADANLVGMKWLLSNAAGGVKVQILNEDVERVRPILEKMNGIPSQFMFNAPKHPCPRCKSTNVRRHVFPIMLGMLLLGFPLPFGRRGFKCRDCGHQFQHFSGEHEA